jgi:hypothetical protein
MANLHSMIGKARRRLIADRSLRLAAMGLVAGLALAVVALALDRFGIVGVPTVLYWLIPAAGLACGVIIGLVRSPRVPDVALHLDRRLHLKDRLATAEALDRRGTTGGLQSEFAPLVATEAQRLAERLDVRSVTPIRLSNSWLLAGAMAILLALGVWYVPQLRTSRSQQEARLAAAQQEKRAEEARTVAQEIKSALEPIDRHAIDEQAAGQLDALDRLAQQLLNPGSEGRDLSKARDESAARMSELAEQMDREAARDEAAADELLERFAGMQAPEAPMTSEQFAEALRWGEFGPAADSLEEYLAARDAMTEEDRRRLADELRRLGDEVEGAAQPGHDPASDERAEQIRQVLRDHGVDEQTIDQLLSEGGSPDDSLAQENIDEPLADQLDQDLRDLQDKRDVQDRAADDAQQIAEALREAARQMEQDESPADQSPPTDQQPPGENPPDAPRSADKPQPSDTRPSSDSQAPGDPSQPQRRDAAERQQPPTSDSPSSDDRKPQEPQRSGKPQSQPAPSQPAPKPAHQPGQEAESGDQKGQDSQTRSEQQNSSSSPQRQDPNHSAKQDKTKQDETGQGETKQDATKQDESGQEETGQDTGRSDGEKPGKDGQSNRERPGGDAAAQQGSKPSSEPTPEPGTKPDTTSGSRPDRDASTPGAQPGRESSSQNEKAPADNAGDQRSNRDRSAGSEESAAPPQAQPGSPDANPGSGSSSDPDAQADQRSSPSEQIRDVAKRREGVSKRRQISEQLRDAAQRMASGQRSDSLQQAQDRGPGSDSDQSPTAPRPPHRIADGIDAGAGPADGAPDLAEPPPFVADDLDDVNLSGTNPGEQIIAEWLTDEPAGEVSPVSAGDGGRIAAAQRAAQRALEQSAVPPRYRGPIQRFFGRLPETVKRAGAGPATPPSPATPPQPAPQSPPSPSAPESGQAKP